MVKRLLEIKKSVNKALVELDLDDWLLSKSEVCLLQSLADCLEVIETASLALGTQDCNLFKAEKIFKYLSLSQKNPPPLASLFMKRSNGKFWKGDKLICQISIL